jgi:transposase
MTAVMIGVDPHKASHTAVAIDASEVPLGTVRIQASASQAARLVEWAADWPERTWAVEGAGGLGHLLAQQLVAAGEKVIDVQPKLGARVRLLSTGTSNENDPNDARSVAVAALRSPGCQQVAADDHALVLRVWSRRHRQLSSLRTQAACRLHAALCEIQPGGLGKDITADRAAAILDAHVPDGPVSLAWHDLAKDHLADLRRIDSRIRRHQETDHRDRPAQDRRCPGTTGFVSRQGMRCALGPSAATDGPKRCTKDRALAVPVFPSRPPDKQTGVSPAPTAAIAPIAAAEAACLNSRKAGLSPP